MPGRRSARTRHSSTGWPGTPPLQDRSPRFPCRSDEPAKQVGCPSRRIDPHAVPIRGHQSGGRPIHAVPARPARLASCCDPPLALPQPLARSDRLSHFASGLPRHSARPPRCWRCSREALDATATLVGGSRALALVGAAVTASMHAVARRSGSSPRTSPGPSNNRPCPKVSARLVMSLLVVVSIVLVASMLGGATG